MSMSFREIYAWKELAEVHKARNSADNMAQTFIAAQGDKQSVEKSIKRLSKIG